MTIISSTVFTLVASLYNPHEQSKEELINNFAVRHNLFKRMFQEIKSSSMKYPEQHYIIEGQRGMGKTTLLLRLSYEIENDNELNTWLIPVVLKEEAHYGITRLFKLWETVALELGNGNKIFTDLHTQMVNAYNENEGYEKKCFTMLSHALSQHALKTILFIDNIGEMFNNFSKMECHRLREILMTCPDIRIVGASTVVLEAFFKYDHAFYEFFKTKKLSGLNSEETRRLLSQLAHTHQKQQAIQTIIAKHPERVETLRILTGGVIRTIILLFEIFIDDQNGNAISDMDKVLDKVTPLYKHRMDDLTPLQREVVNAIALHWDAVEINEIACMTRLKAGEITPVLSELQKLFIIRRVPTGSQKNLFHLQERFFNIWYLMRLASKGCQTKVLWLVRFLESWYDKDELVKRAQKHIKAITKGDYQPKDAYYFTEALARTCKLDLDTEHDLISATENFLLEKDESLATVLSQSDKRLLEKWQEHVKNKEYRKSLNVLLEIKNKKIFFIQYGVTYFELDNYEKAEKYFLMAVDSGHTIAMYILGLFYIVTMRNDKKAEKYCLMAVDKGQTDAIVALGHLYFYHLKDYEKAEKYYLMSVEAEKSDVSPLDEDHLEVMYNLAFLYFGQKKHKEDALKLSKKSILLKKNIITIILLSNAYLWNNQIENSINMINEALHDNMFVDEYANIFGEYLMLLISKKQFQYTTAYFETSDLNLKEKLKPLYYAFLKITGDENFYKIPPELSEPVNEIVAKIRQMEIDYA